MNSPEEKNDFYFQRKKLLLLINLAGVFFFLLVMSFSFSHPLFNIITKFTGSTIFVITLYVFFFYLFYFFWMFPLKYYEEFIFERKSGSSCQSFRDWFRKIVQVETIIFSVFLIAVQVLYYFLETNENRWWMQAALCGIFVVCLCGDAFARFIAPLFLRYKEVKDEELKKRLITLAQSQSIMIENVYVSPLCMGGSTVILAGAGHRRKIILRDTILDYAKEEIEVILAREIAYYSFGFIWKTLFFQMAAIVIACFFTGILLEPVERWFGFDLIFAIETLPVVLALFFIFFIISIYVQGFYKRRIQIRMDWFALQLTQAPEAFISLLIRMLGHGADNQGNYILEQIMEPRATIKQRIAMAEDYAQNLRFEKINKKSKAES